MSAQLPMKFTLAPSGYVGIGTSTPMSQLHVEGNVFSSGTMTASNLVITGDYVFFNTVTSNSDPFIIRNEKQSTAFTVAQVGVGTGFPVAEFYDTSGNVALQIANTGDVNVGKTMTVIGDVVCNRIIGNASNVTGLAASAKTDTTNATNITTGTLSAARLPPLIQATNVTGNVGIGTVSPAATLEVRGSSILAAPPMIPPVPLNATSVTVTGSGFAKYDGLYTVVVSPGSTGASTIFDMNDNTIWRTDTNYKPMYDPITGGQSTIVQGVRYAGDFVEITVPSATFVYTYTIVKSTTLENTPVSWDLIGTNGNNNYFLIHSVRDANTFGGTFMVQSTMAFTTFRLIISQTAGGTRASIAGWYINGDTYVYRGARITGNLAIGATPDVTRVVVNSTGIGIGTTSPQQALHIGPVGNIRIDDLIGSSTRSLVVTPSGTLAVSLSDARLKTDVAPLQYGLNDLMKLRPVTFKWQDTCGYGNGTDCGLIAQEVEKILPDIGIIDRSAADGGTYTLDYTKLIPLLIKSIQELAALRL